MGATADGEWSGAEELVCRKVVRLAVNVRCSNSLHSVNTMAQWLPTAPQGCLHTENMFDYIVFG